MPALIVPPQFLRVSRQNCMRVAVRDQTTGAFAWLSRSLRIPDGSGGVVLVGRPYTVVALSELQMIELVTNTCQDRWPGHGLEGAEYVSWLEGMGRVTVDRAFVASGRWEVTAGAYLKGWQPTEIEEAETGYAALTGWDTGE